MFAKIYRYRIRPEKRGEFLSIQGRVSRIYRKYVRFRVVHLVDVGEPNRWVEIQWYPDEETYNLSIAEINQDPEIDKLWKEFQEILDPGKREISEEDFIQVLEDGNLVEGTR